MAAGGSPGIQRRDGSLLRVLKGFVELVYSKRDAPLLIVDPHELRLGEDKVAGSKESSVRWEDKRGGRSARRRVAALRNPRGSQEHGIVVLVRIVHPLLRLQFVPELERVMRERARIHRPPSADMTTHPRQDRTLLEREVPHMSRRDLWQQKVSVSPITEPRGARARVHVLPAHLRCCGHGSPVAVSGLSRIRFRYVPRCRLQQGAVSEALRCSRRDGASSRRRSLALDPRLSGETESRKRVC